MTDQHVRDFLERMSVEEPLPFLDPEPLARRARRRAGRTVVVGALGMAAAIAVAFAGASQLRGWTQRVPVNPPEERQVDLGIFAPITGRIVYHTFHADSGLWGIDPNAPSPGSTQVRIDVGGPDDVDRLTMPLGWSSDGTELLLMRQGNRPDMSREPPFPNYLYILRADGTEIQVTPEPVGDAAISPDGSRVAFTTTGAFGTTDGGGMYVVDADGGEPVRIAQEGASPTFSPDGTRIAYVSTEPGSMSGEVGEAPVWVANVDGTDTQEILADEPRLENASLRLTWSPASDHLAMSVDVERDIAIYTFAPDGSDFTKVISGGFNPQWSPDGSQIAYQMPTRGPSDKGGAPLAVADADGSNVQVFDFGGVGPWHPGTATAPVDEDGSTSAPTSVDPPSSTSSGEILGGPDEVLSFRPEGNSGQAALVAVSPGTREERVVAEGFKDVVNARWAADRRWVAFETRGVVRVVDASSEARRIAGDGTELAGYPLLWDWSSTGAELAVLHGSTLSVVDPATGLSTELASTVGDVTSVPAWSPDGTTIVYGARGGSIYSVDVRTGDRSLLVQLPGEDLDSVDGIEWSPDRTQLAIYNDQEPGDGTLFIVNADGSNVRVLTDEVIVFGFDWSPDGLRLAWTEDHGGQFHVVTASADGSAGSIVEILPNGPSNPVWSPDGSRIALGHQNAYLSDGAPNLVLEADGSGEAVRLDDLTYESWRGGFYDCDCDIFG
jgi:Tol biopolymer transport system component